MGSLVAHLQSNYKIDCEGINEDRIVEPFSEGEDYLDKDDFSHLLNVLG